MQTFSPSLAACLRLLWLLGLPLVGRAQMPAFEFARGYATGTYAGVQTLTVDAAGNTYFVGTFAGTQTFGATVLTSLPQAGSPGTASDDLVVAKLDPTGNFLWAARLGSDSYDYAGGVAVDAQGNVYATGYFYGYSWSVNTTGPLLYNSSAEPEIFLVKLNGATGQPLWWRRAGGTGAETSNCVAVNAAGEVFLGGSVGSATADFGPLTLTNSHGPGQKGDGFVAKLTSAGSWQSVVAVGGTGLISISKIVPDNAGMLFLSAYIQHGTGVFGATTLRANTAPNSSLGSGDIVVAKISEQGAWQWAVQGDGVDGNNQLGAVGPAYDGAGHLYLAGSFRTQTARLGPFVLASRSSPFYVGGGGTPYWAYPDDGFVARLDAQTGAWEWAVQAGGTGYDLIGAVEADGQGRVYVMGNGQIQYSGFESPLPGGGRMHLAQLDGATGAWRWANSLGAYVEGRGMGLGPGGKLTIGGGLRRSPGSFPPLAVAGTGSNQVNGFIARLSAAGPLGAKPGGGPAAFSVWPNPARERQVWVAGGHGGQPVVVSDVLGREVFRRIMPAHGPLSLDLPVGLPAGLYVVRCQDMAQKIVLE